MFIKTLEDVLLPVSRIEFIGPERHDGRTGTYRTIRTIEGEKYTIGAGDPQLVIILGTTIKADPGFELLPDREPVIAWRIGRHFAPQPITTSSTFPGSDLFEGYEWAVICPNGKVIRPDGPPFASIQEWEENERRNQEEAD